MIHRKESDLPKGFNDLKLKQTKDLKFLIVGYSSKMYQIITNSLKSIGYKNFVQIDDGRKALENLNADHSIDFVIIEWDMFSVSTLVTVEKIRKDFEKLLPIILITFRAVNPNRAEVFKIIDDYILQPFTPQVLEDKINKIISNLSCQELVKKVTDAATSAIQNSEHEYVT